MQSDCLSAICTQRAKSNLLNKRVKEQRKKREVTNGQKDSSAKNPNKKKKIAVSSRNIPYDRERHLPVLKKKIATTIIEEPFFNKKLLYSALTHECMVFYTFPLLLQRTKKKAVLPDEFLAGTTSPPAIFTVIQMAFNELFPDREPTSVKDWEIYKWNFTYYGSGYFKQAKEQNSYQWAMLSTRPFGGTKHPIQTNVAIERGHSKSKFAVPISTVIPKQRDEKEDPTFLLSDLDNIIEKSEQLSNDEDFIKKMDEDILKKERLVDEDEEDVDQSEESDAGSSDDE